MHILCVYVTIFIGEKHIWNYLDHYPPIYQVTDKLGTQASSPPWLNLETKAIRVQVLVPITQTGLYSRYGKTDFQDAAKW